MYTQGELISAMMWRHKKSRNIYFITGTSICSTNGEGNGVRCVTYVNTEGECFHREISEFLDGRFEPLSSDILKKMEVKES